MILLLLAVLFPSHESGRCVYDATGVFHPYETAAMQATCERLDRGGRAAIAVAVVNDLQGLSRPEYAAGLFKAWGLGHRGRDDGLLILLALPPADRGIKIEVGYGLEGSLNDGKVMAILRDRGLPELRAGHYGAAVLALMREYGAIVEVQAVVPARQQGAPLWMWLLIAGAILAVAITLWIVWRVSRRRREEEEGVFPLPPPSVPVQQAIGGTTIIRERDYVPMPIYQPVYAPPVVVEHHYHRDPGPAPSYSSSDSSSSDSGFSSSDSSSSDFGGFDSGSSGGGGGDSSF